MIYVLKEIYITLLNVNKVTFSFLKDYTQFSTLICMKYTVCLVKIHQAQVTAKV